MYNKYPRHFGQGVQEPAALSETSTQALILLFSDMPCCPSELDVGNTAELSITEMTCINSHLFVNLTVRIAARRA